ncbi:MAG: carboxypeptidase-like regulatory domain-containing protein, partial [Muribaculaceae bacterium]|nr:carboxypeptidase-like regulatory domain-containing protein [Muribaculaceae bacterium]
MKQTILITTLLTACSLTAAARTISISGKVTDAVDGEGLPACALVVNAGEYVAVTDIDGSFSLRVTTGKINISVSYTGYEKYERTIDLVESVVLPIKLVPSINGLQEVVVT